MKINPKYRQITFVFIMSVLFSFFLSGILIIALRGFIPHFISFWMRNWGYAFLIAVGLNLFLPAKVRHFTSKFTNGGKYVYPFIISIIMTFIFSFALTTINLHGFKPDFFNFWMRGWLVAFICVFILNLFVPQRVGKLVGKLTS